MPCGQNGGQSVRTVLYQTNCCDWTPNERSLRAGKLYHLRIRGTAGSPTSSDSL